MDDKIVKLAADAAKELGLDKLAPTVYVDVLQPAAQESGKNLLVVAKALGIVMSPLRVTVWTYEQISAYLVRRVAAKLANTPAEEIKPPDPAVAGHTMLGMALASEAPGLREMFANLLATAMHAPSASKALPSFATAIQQLSPAEGLILERISDIYASTYCHTTTLWGTTEPVPENPLNRSTFIRSEWLKLCADCGTTDPVLADAYRNNLVRLGVLAEGYEFLKAKADYNGTVELTDEKELNVSSYGGLFLEVCVRGI